MHASKAFLAIGKLMNANHKDVQVGLLNSSKLGNEPGAGKITGNTHFPLVQTMRGLAAFWVVLYHMEGGGHISELVAVMPTILGEVLFRWGHFGVPIFFALSGFVIAHSLRGVRLSPLTFARFALRRSIRLDPPFWVAIALVILVSYVSALFKAEPFMPPDVATVASHLVYLQVILGTQTLNPVFWTLTYEIQFYLFFAFMLMIGTLQKWGEHGQKAIWLTMMALAIISALQGFAGLHEGIFLKLWASFFAGSWLTTASKIAGHNVALLFWC